MSSISMQSVQSKITVLALSVLALCFFASTISVSLVTVTYLLAFFLVLLSGNWQARWRQLQGNWGALSFWVLFALFLIGLVYTVSPIHIALKDLHKRHWMLMTPFFVMLIRDEKWRVRMLNFFLTSMLVTLLLSYVKVLTHINVYQFLPRSIHTEYSFGSVFMDYINQSLAMSIAAFICGYRYLFESRWRFFYATLFVLMAINVFFMSSGRTGYGIFLLLVAYLASCRFGWRGFIVAVALSAMMVASAFYLSPEFRSRMGLVHAAVRHAGKEPGGSITQRLEMLHIAKYLIVNRPWFGYGTGGVRAIMSDVVPAKYRKINPSLDYVENIYLNMLMQFGVFGLLVFLLVIAVQIKTSFELPRQYRYLFQAVLIATLSGGMLNSFFVSFIPAHLYALFSALCLSSRKTPLESK